MALASLKSAFPRAKFTQTECCDIHYDFCHFLVFLHIANVQCTFNDELAYFKVVNLYANNVNSYFTTWIELMGKSSNITPEAFWLRIIPVIIAYL